MSALKTLDDLEQQIGAFARIFPRSSVEDIADAFVKNSLVQVQLNLSALGLPTVPYGTDLKQMNLAGVRSVFESRDLSMWGISATYNIAHPDNALRKASTVQAAQFIKAMADSGAAAATLCTGSRDPQNMWRRHPDNSTESAWRDMRQSLDSLLAAADEAGIQLAVEPEPGNIVSGAAKALRLIRELGDDASRIGFILDPANLVSDYDRQQHETVLRGAFDHLGDKTICVHAKDTVPWAETLEGRGVIDYDIVLSLRSRLPVQVPLIIQDATEEQIPKVSQMLREAASRVL